MTQVHTGKTVPKGVGKPQRPSFVFGSRPDYVRMPRIKPAAASTTMYGKDINQSKNGVADAGFGTTGDY